MRTCDVIVLGAGPAGGHAALAAAGAGLDVVLIDEAAAAGGQVWRAPLAGVAQTGPDARDGDALRAALAAAPVEARFGRRVWTVTGAFRVDAVGPDGGEAVAAPSLIAATGAHERVVPFAGWTLPGVVGLAAATVLLKSHGVAPGARVVVAGCGPLLAAVAAALVKAGVAVCAVADLASPGEWLRAAPALLARPRLVARGLGWAVRLAGARVPVLFRHTVRRAEGEEAVRRVVLAPVDADGAFAAGAETAFDVDALVVGHGLVPGGEVPRLLRAEQRYDRVRGGWVPRLDGFGRTGVPGLFAVGDGAGVRGAAPAVHAGRLAGLAAAHDLGRLDAASFAARAAADRAALARFAPFADAVAGLMALRHGQVGAIAPDTVVCRCEDVTRGEIDGAIADGAREVNQLKHFTRCGMGPCQGRMCGDVVGALVARAVGSREAAGVWTGRPPLRPVALADLIGTFDYADIPIPEPAPL